MFFDPSTLGWISIAISTLFTLFPYFTSNLLNTTLPKPTGQYIVGSFLTRSNIGNKSLIRYFYPTSKVGNGGGSSDSIPENGKWLPSFIYYKGYARFLGFADNSFLLYIMRSLIYVCGRWIDQKEENVRIYHDDDDDDRKYPVLIFSHGMGGSQSMYSIICTEMASRGFIVVVPEHTDGSASCTIDSNGKTIFAEFESDQKFLLERRDILGTDDRDAIRNDKASREYMINWRNKQSQIRVEDVFQALSFTCEHEILKQYIDKNNVNIMGHSFGGTSVLGAIARIGGRMEKNDTIIHRFNSAIVLDGWMWPIVGDDENSYFIDEKFGGNDEERNNSLVKQNTPILFIDAHTFIDNLVWYSTKIEIAQRYKTHHGENNSDVMLLNLKHSAHFTFSDVLVLGGKAYPILNQYRSRPQTLKKKVNDEEEKEDGIPTQEELLFSIMNLSYDFMQQYHNGGGGGGGGSDTLLMVGDDDTWRSNINYKLYKVISDSRQGGSGKL